MPIPTDTLYNMRRVNVWFAFASLALLAATLWMVWDDYDRPWRDHQRDYIRLQAVVAEIDYQLTQTPAAKEARRVAQADVTAARESLSSDAEVIAGLERDLDDLRGPAQALRIEFSMVDAEHLVLKDKYEKHKTLLGLDAAETKATEARLEDLRTRRDDTKRRQEENEDKQAEIERQLKKIDQPVDDAQKALAQLQRVVTATRKRRDALTAVVTNALINAPLLDFMAPKGTLAHVEVKQVLLTDVRSEYNYLQHNTADRCSTCHIGIDQPDFTRDAIVARFETAVQTLDGRSLGYTNADGEEVPWDRISRDLQDEWLAGVLNPDEPDVPLDDGTVARLTESQRLDTVLEHLRPRVKPYLERQGLTVLDMDRLKPLFAHPRLDLFVGADSPHPMNKMGCTVCHEGNGDETDFVFAAHTPHDPHELHEWEKKYVPMYGGYDFHTIEHYWDTPMLETKYTSASCAKCHDRISDVTTYKAQPLELGKPIAQGRQLFTSTGCANCHLVEPLRDTRRVGPDLTNLARKTTKAFVAEWVNYPGNYRPSTFMPHFFEQENNSSASATDDDPDPIGRTRTEVAALTHYLFEVSRLDFLKSADDNAATWTAQAPPADLQPTDATQRSLAVERGRALFGTVGCLACHAALAHQPFPSDVESQQDWIRSELGRQGRDNATAAAQAMPDVQRLEFLRANYPTQGQTWIARDLEEREGLGADEATTRAKGMTYVEQAQYAVDHFDSDMTAIFDGPQAIEDRPVFTRFAPELSSIRSKFADDEKAVTWLYDWVVNPRHYSSYTKMPSLRLEPREALDVALYLSTLNANTAFNERVASSTIAADPAKVDALLMGLLRGQNSEAAARMILRDENGALTDQLVALLQASYGPDRARTAISVMTNADKKLLFFGSKMMTHYGCYACHLVTGYETAARPGTELTYWAEKSIAQLDFAFFGPAFDGKRGKEFTDLYLERDAHLIEAAHTNPEQKLLHNHGSFAWHKLRNPRIFDRGKLKGPYDKLKMPNFFFTDAEADMLVTYLLSRRHPLVNEAVRVPYESTARGGLAKGRHLTRELNCVGCHRIEDNGAVIHQFFRMNLGGQEIFDTDNAPPWLRGEGAKVQHDWLFRFLGNVEMLRPWLNVRMPSFTLDHDQADTLVKYFADVARYEADTLEQAVDPVRKYLTRVHEAAGRTLPTASFAPPLTQDDSPGTDWYSEDSLRISTRFVAGYAAENQFPADDPLDPELLPEERTDTFRQIFNQAAFVGDLYDVPYPFVATPTGFGDEDRFRRGEALLYDRECLACHVLGDPSKRPAGQGPVSAPNLNLTHERLRYDWVRGWLRYPAVIQPRTKMPSLFGEGTATSTFIDDPDPASRQRAEARFGATGTEQIDLLVDFLFEAGKRGYDAVQPPRPAQPAAAAAGD